MANKKRVLITGVSGLLGSNLGFRWKDQYDVLGTFNTHPVHLQGIQTRRVDLLSDDAMHQVVNDFKPDIVVHGAALANIDACQDNKELALSMNAHMVTGVVNALSRSHAKLIFISTDSVYGGDQGNHTEEEKVNPIHYYAHTKYLGELEALRYPDALVVRTAFFGWNIQDKLSFAQQIVSKLSNHQQVKGFRDVETSMIYTFDLADLLDKAIQKDLKGIYNVGCRMSQTKYDFAVLLAKEFNLSISLIEPISVDDFDFKASRGKNQGMSVAKLSEILKEEILTLEQSVKNYSDDFKRKIPQF